MKLIKEIIDILKLENITGLDAARHITNFLMSRYLTIDKCKLFNINSKYAFENLYKENISEDCDHEKALSKFWNTTDECFIKIIYKLLNLKNTHFECKVKSGINFGLIYNKLNELDLNNKVNNKCYIDLCVLNVFKNNKDFLQNYTDSILCDFMVNLCKPKMKTKNDIESIIDPFCGTGGFLIKAVSYLDNNNKNINWDLNKNRIYGIEIDPIYRNGTIFKLLFNTNKIFNSTIGCFDSLHDDYKINDNTVIDKVDIIVSHMPYGIKNIIYKTVCKRIKELKIDGTKAEPLILQLMMKSLNPNGRCSVIVPDNLLLNDAKLHKQTRTYLIENFNIKKIISIDDDILKTSVKSSVIYFINNGKTDEIEFSSIKFKNKENNEIIEESLMNVSYDDIVQNEYSLYINKYNNKKVVLIDEINYDKLGNMFQINSGLKLKKEDVLDINDNQPNNTKYFYYNGTDKSCITKQYNTLENTVICSKVKNNSDPVKLVNKKIWLNENGISLSKKVDTITLEPKFLNYYLLSRKEELDNCYNSKGILSIDILKDIMIPIPSYDVQQKIISTIDLFNKKLEDNKRLIDTGIEMQKNLIWLNLLNNINDEDKLKDVVSIESGSVVPVNPLNNVVHYEVYGGNITNTYTHKYNYDNKIILSKFSDDSSVKYVKKKFYLNQQGWALKINNSNYLEEYVYIWLWYNQKNIFMGSGNILHQTNFLNLKIAKIDIDLQKKIISEFNYHEKINDLLTNDYTNTNKYFPINIILSSRSKLEVGSDTSALDKIEESDLSIEYLTKDYID